LFILFLFYYEIYFFRKLHFWVIGLALILMIANAIALYRWNKNRNEVILSFNHQLANDIAHFLFVDPAAKRVQEIQFSMKCCGTDKWYIYQKYPSQFPN